MSEFTVARLLDAPRERVWRALTQPDSFERVVCEFLVVCHRWMT